MTLLVKISDHFNFRQNKCPNIKPSVVLKRPKYLQFLVSSIRRIRVATLVEIVKA